MVFCQIRFTTCKKGLLDDIFAGHAPIPAGDTLSTTSTIGWDMGIVHVSKVSLVHCKDWGVWVKMINAQFMGQFWCFKSDWFPVGFPILKWGGSSTLRSTGLENTRFKGKLYLTEGPGIFRKPCFITGCFFSPRLTCWCGMISRIGPSASLVNS